MAISFQNGLGNEEIIGEVVGAENVLGGLTAQGAHEDLALRRWELASILDDRVDDAVAQLREVVRLPVVARAGREQGVERLLPSLVGLWTDVFPKDGPKRAQRLDQTGSIGRR